MKNCFYETVKYNWLYISPCVDHLSPSTEPPHYCTHSALYSCWSNLISGRAKLTFRLRHNFVMKN